MLKLNGFDLILETTVEPPQTPRMPMRPREMPIMADDRTSDGGIMKYRRRNGVVVEAEQFDKDSAKRLPRDVRRGTGSPDWVVDTVWGPLPINRGVWIVRDVGSKLGSPVSDEVFKREYRPDTEMPSWSNSIQGCDVQRRVQKNDGGPGRTTLPTRECSPTPWSGGTDGSVYDARGTLIGKMHAGRDALRAAVCVNGVDKLGAWLDV